MMEQPSIPMEMYWHKYSDTMCEELKRTFDQGDLKIAVDIGQLLLDLANGIARTESIRTSDLI